MVRPMSASLRGTVSGALIVMGTLALGMPGMSGCASAPPPKPKQQAKAEPPPAPEPEPEIELPPATTCDEADSLAGAKSCGDDPNCAQGKMAQVRSVVRANYPRFDACFRRGLRKDSSLQGKVVVQFAIGPDGVVHQASDQGSELSDNEVVGCVVEAFRGICFPKPEMGIQTVTYPLNFSTE